MKVEIETSISQTKDVIGRAKDVMLHPVLQGLQDIYIPHKSSKVSQILLSMKYKEWLAQKVPLPHFEEVEFRTFSQHGEDGILLYIFSLLGTTNKKCVELCGGGGYDNTTNLIINHGWHGLFFDGGEKKIRKGQRFYARCADTKTWPPRLVQAWITAENINSLLQEHGMAGEIDLLSLDMDGVDYWVWKALACIQPRVVVLEYNNILGPDVSVTIPYKPDFTMEESRVSELGYQARRIVNTFVGKSIADRHAAYYGASLSAFVKLGKQKGYRLVGCERYGHNAFFVRSGLGEEVLPGVSPPECFGHPFIKYMMEVRVQEIVDREWVEV
jgi:hypothetical protein